MSLSVVVDARLLLGFFLLSFSENFSTGKAKAYIDDFYRSIEFFSLSVEDSFEVDICLGNVP